MLKRIRAAALLLAVLCMIAGLAGCSGKDAGLMELDEPAGVKSDTAAAYIGEIYNLHTYEGVVSAYVEELSFAVNGKVGDVPGYAGKQVEAGEELIRLDFSNEEKRVEELRTGLEYEEKDNALADRLAEIEIESVRNQLWQLYDSGADWTQTYPKELEIDELEARLRQAQELRQIDIDARKQELAELEETIAGGTLTAPFAGRVIYCNLAAGSSVIAGSPVAYLADKSKLSVYTAHLTEATLQTAHRIYAMIGGETYDLTPRPEDQEEYLTKVMLGEETRTYYDFAGTDGVPPELEAGQYAVVCLIDNYAADAVLVPRGALYNDSTGRYVYVDVNGSQERRNVKVGVTTQSLAQITEGLEEGEVVYVKD